jgi:hypothetical protein
MPVLTADVPRFAAFIIYLLSAASAQDFALVFGTIPCVAAMPLCVCVRARLYVITS